ncbi:MAG: LemA family protein [Sphingobacteriales bacterium]|nr:LemA family protein [Sphingobacteriales bacterium]
MNRNILIFVGIIAMVVLFGGCGYNSMVKLDEKVNSQWAQVENVYQRRSDLIPNLVNTVKGYANFEKDVLISVTEARSKATSVNVDASKLTPESIQQFQAAQGQLTSALSKLLVVVEKYPDLKANQNFLELQAQLEGTENRIAVERNSFNKVTQEYNSMIRSFPNNITAGIFGFAKKGYFEAEKGAEKAPEVKF